MESITFLDCTLRDGGYYNDWDFNPEKANLLIQALSKSGVDIIEVGYKSNVKDKYFGLFRYCNEQYLEYLRNITTSEFAFMIDAAEFVLADGSLNSQSLDETILEKEESVFSWVRIASHFTGYRSMPALIKYFRKKGYKICYNLMGGSLLTQKDIQSAIEILGDHVPDVFYVADSLGSFYPEDVKILVRFLKTIFPKKIGIHTHDNQGMAYANTLVAIEEGVDFVDGTVTGMGRGSGNLHTEQFLQGYSLRYNSTKYQPSYLLKIIDDFIEPLKQKYKWGYNYSYMLSGLNNIHPMYCQHLSEGNRYTQQEVTAILHKIPVDNRSKFNKKTLETAIQDTIASASADEHEIQLSVAPKTELKDVLVIARGESVKEHIYSIENFIKRHDIVVIEVNPIKILNCATQFRVILNKVRLVEHLGAGNIGSATIITGQTHISEKIYNSNVKYCPFDLGDFHLSQNSISIPDYDAGMFAIGFALLNSAKCIYLAGFDGFGSEQEWMNQRMESFFDMLKKETNRLGSQVVCVTPTRYKNTQQKSLYSL